MTDYPKEMTLRPLVAWPHDYTTERRRSPFRSTWSSTIQLLDNELWQLGPINGGNAPSVLQVAIDESKFRRNGMPRADATPIHPGVIVNIESRHGSLSYPCDTFDRWQDNLRAIALALEALRKIARYGIANTGQQYRGWAEIEATPASFTGPRVALEFLAGVAGVDLPVSADDAASLYKRARSVSHPDRPTGSRAQWDRVEQAGAFLRRVGWMQ